MTIKQFMDYYEKNLETELIEFCEKYIDLDEILTQEQDKKTWNYFKKKYNS